MTNWLSWVKSALFTWQDFAAAQEFPIDFGDLLQNLQDFLIGLDAAASLQDLSITLEQERAHLPFGQAAAQIEERTMFFTLAAVAVGAAAFEETLQEGGVDQLRRELEGFKQAGLALAQGESGEALWFCLTHVLCKITGYEANASENETDPPMRKCLSQAYTPKIEKVNGATSKRVAKPLAVVFCRIFVN